MNYKKEKQRVSSHLKTKRLSNFRKYIYTNSSKLFKIYTNWLLIFGGVFSKYHLAYFPFDSYIPGSSRVGRNFIFQKNMLTERSLQCACHSVNWMVTEWWLKCDWNPPFPSQFSRLSATIKSPFSRLKVKISSCAY